MDDANKNQFIAHVRHSDGAVQPLYDHLTGTAEIAGRLASKIGLPLCGALIGLVHDLGKYSEAFQEYIKKCVKYDNPESFNFDLDENDDEEAERLVGGKPKRGSVDHSTAGGQFLFHHLYNKNHLLKSNAPNNDRTNTLNQGNASLLAHILLICVASHHSGLINVVGDNGKQVLNKRRDKCEQDAHLKEALENAKADGLFANLPANWQHQLVAEFSQFLMPILRQVSRQVPLLVKQFNLTPSQHLRTVSLDFQVGFATRMLFSCLIDADRSNSIAFEHLEQARLLQPSQPNWQLAIDKVEALYLEFATHAKNAPPDPINLERTRIADTCLNQSQSEQGVFSLTVPTGGGKTLASLRFALHHAKRHDLERIIFIIPYTSIIEQNAEAVREVLETKDANGCFSGEWVLEQHSNLEPIVQTWQSKLVLDNWNAPIVFTTMVQFLESCFGGGTKGVRRLHQMSRAVLVFDEIQTLPVTCYHLFNNAINFLTRHAGTTAVLCTATQPVLHRLGTTQPVIERGLLDTPTEIIGDNQQLQTLFNTLKRVNIHDHTTPPLNEDSITDFVDDIYAKHASTLVIVNIKSQASTLFEALRSRIDDPDALFHLSTGQCPAHRKDLIRIIKARLAQNLPTLVISTQLIEAGVDISFASVVRFLVGLDSVLQASGRCNRHGKLTDKNGKAKKGDVYLITPKDENLSFLPWIKAGKKVMSSLLRQLAQPDSPYADLLDPDLVSNYFRKLYLQPAMQQQMAYPLPKDTHTTLLSLLSDNHRNPYLDNDNWQRLKNRQFPNLYQSFMDAGRAFQAIDAPTQAVIVPYQPHKLLKKYDYDGCGVEWNMADPPPNQQSPNGNTLITDLFGMEVTDRHFYQLVRDAQQFSINVFPHVFKKLMESNAITQVQDTGIYALSEAFYDEMMGLRVEGGGALDFLGGW